MCIHLLWFAFSDKQLSVLWSPAGTPAGAHRVVTVLALLGTCTVRGGHQGRYPGQVAVLLAT